MENYGSRQVVESLDKLVYLSILNDNRTLKWKQALIHYNDSIIIMQNKGEDYTQDKLRTYKFHADHFYELWVRLNGR